MCGRLRWRVGLSFPRHKEEHQRGLWPCVCSGARGWARILALSSAVCKDGYSRVAPSNMILNHTDTSRYWPFYGLLASLQGLYWWQTVQKTTREGWLKSEVIAKDQNFLYWILFPFRAHPKRAVKCFLWVRYFSQVNREPCAHEFVLSPLLLTCCVIMTGSSVDAVGNVFYQLVCAPVVKRCMSETGPLKKLWSYFKLWPQFQNTSRFSLASHHQPPDTYLNEVNGRLLYKDHLHNTEVLWPGFSIY